MLALTDNAVQAVKQIVSASDPEAETSGMRVSAAPGEQSNFQLSIAKLPGEDDEVVEEGGARVFLDQAAASALGDKVLDADVVENRVAFTIMSQPS